MSDLRMLVQSAELECPSAVDGEALCFKIEIYQDAGDVRAFRARVFRYDLFRLLPTFPGSSGIDVADHEVLVSDPMFGSLELSAISPDDALREVVARIKLQFGEID